MSDSGHGKIEDNPKILSGPVLTNSPNAVLSKTLLGRYNDLPIPVDRILATYVWIDGTGEHLRCKDRTLTFIPKQPKGKMTILDEIDKIATVAVWNTIQPTYEAEYLPPYFFPKGLDDIFDVQCKWREKANTHSFDENFKGFTPILSQT